MLVLTMKWDDGKDEGKRRQQEGAFFDVSVAAEALAGNQENALGVRVSVAAGALAEIRKGVFCQFSVAARALAEV